jgi:uncharacterized protein
MMCNLLPIARKVSPQPIAIPQSIDKRRVPHLLRAPYGVFVLNFDHQSLKNTKGANWLVALVLIGVPFIAANMATKLFLSGPDMRDINNFIKVLVLLGSYWTYVRWWETRDVHELSLAKALPEFLAGLLLGTVLFLSVVLVLGLLGVYSLDQIDTVGGLGNAITHMLPKMTAGALIEELLFRLLLLRLLERSFGTAIALALSSLIFGFAHLGNVGASPMVCVLLGLELGLLFGAAFLLTRRLWLCAALHLSWNFMQGAVFSIAVSGQSGHGWLRSSLTGPDWLTGGAFGAEASIVSVAVCLIGSLFLLYLSYTQKKARPAAQKDVAAISNTSIGV